jgi:hypothetical protein
VASSIATSLVPAPRHPTGLCAPPGHAERRQSNTINLSPSTYTLTTINNFCVVALDDVLPFAVMVRTAQGLLAGGVQLGLSASGTLVVESINAQGLVVSAEPL